jgi:hypothetical protein
MNMTWILRSKVSIFLVHLLLSFGACLHERGPGLHSMDALFLLPSGVGVSGMWYWHHSHHCMSPSSLAEHYNAGQLKERDLSVFGILPVLSFCVSFWGATSGPEACT